MADRYEYAWVNTETGEVVGLHRNPTSRWLRDKSWAPGPQWRRMRRIPASKWQDIEPAARSVSDPKENRNEAHSDHSLDAQVPRLRRPVTP